MITLATKWLGRVGVATVVLLAGLAVTAWGWHTLRDREAVETHRRYTALGQHFCDGVRERLRAYEMLVLGAASFIETVPECGPEQWSRYVAQLSHDRPWPGLIAVGMIAAVPRDQLDGFVERMRARGRPDFHVTPPGDRPLYCVITQVAPASDPQSIVGFDIAASPESVPALERSRDDDRPILSAPLHLPQHPGTNLSVVLHAPFYRLPDTTLTTVAARRAALAGWAATPLRLDDLLRDSFDGVGTSMDAALFDTTDPQHPAWLGGSRAADGPHPSDPAQDHGMRTSFEVAGRRWEWQGRPRATGPRAVLAARSTSFLVFGVAVSVLLAAAVQGLIYVRQRPARQALALRLAALEACGEMIVITDTRAIIQYVNPAFTRGTGYTPAQVLGRHTAILKSDRHDQAFYRDLWQTINAGKVWRGTMTNRRRDGSLYPEEMTIAPVRDEAGTIVHFVAIKHDITRRQQAESALREAEQRYHTLVDSLPVGVYSATAGPEGQCLAANPALLAIQGYDSLEEFMRIPLAQHYNNPAERAVFSALLLAQGTLRGYETQLKKKNGQRIWARFSSHVLRDADGTARYYGIVEDITEHKLAEAALREQHSLQDAVRAMERVLGVVGHELRTPLAALRATSELMLTEALAAEQQQQFLHLINDEAIRMADTVNNILEAARLNSGLAKWNWGPVNLLDSVARAMASVTPLISPSVVLDIDGVPPDLELRGDADALRRLVLNLVSNAYKHTTAGTIRVAAHPEGSYVVLTVQDTGTGMPPEVLRKLGVAFALNAGVVGGQATGSGLGLAICKGILAAHGGTMSFDSEPGRGTTVTARWRADLPEPLPLPTETASREEVLP
jgi:PAS domain S-box-containing protein